METENKIDLKMIAWRKIEVQSSICHLNESHCLKISLWKRAVDKKPKNVKEKLPYTQLNCVYMWIFFNYIAQRKLQNEGITFIFRVFHPSYFYYRMNNTFLLHPFARNVKSKRKKNSTLLANDCVCVVDLVFRIILFIRGKSMLCWYHFVDEDKYFE